MGEHNMEPIFIALSVLLVIFVIINLWFTYKIFSRSSESFLNEIKNEVQNFEKNLQKIEAAMKDEFSRNREENSKNFKDLRGELGASFKNFEDSILKRIAEMSEFQKSQFEGFSTQLNNLTKSNEDKIEKMAQSVQERLNQFNDQLTSNLKATREDLSKSLKSFEDRLSANFKEVNETQAKKFEALVLKQDEMIKVTDQKIEKIRETNEAHHIKMTNTIQEKLNYFQEQMNTNAQNNREELSKSLKSFEESFTLSVNGFNELQKQKFEELASKQAELSKTTETKLEAMRLSNESNNEKTNKTLQDKMNYFQEQINSNAKSNREELAKSLKNFEDTFIAKVNEFNELQKQKFDGLTNRQNELVQVTEQRLEKMRETVEQKLKIIQDDSNAKLEIIRQTVDEKLHKTLEQRLGDSFKIVSERLELVHKGLGEMQNLAVGVGDLKKVLSNVKNRGVLGEYQLENILEQLLTNEQFGRNVKTKHDSQTLVEFAVKLPGKDDKKPLWLPVDAKFPTEHYIALTEAYEQGDLDAVNEKRKMLAHSIRSCAKDINEKYIDPPNTTDFGIMFLPFEGLYAEVLRTDGLFENVQRDYKVIITGPTTLSALLNSLQIGFKTLVIEKRSSEVWELLGAVKTEFGKFGAVLDKTQKKLEEASNVIRTAGVRTRAIEKKLKGVEQLPAENAERLLGGPDNLLEFVDADESVVEAEK